MNLTESDQGNYICEASNRAGLDVSPKAEVCYKPIIYWLDLLCLHRFLSWIRPGTRAIHNPCQKSTLYPRDVKSNRLMLASVILIRRKRIVVSIKINSRRSVNHSAWTKNPSIAVGPSRPKRKMLDVNHPVHQITRIPFQLPVNSPADVLNAQAYNNYYWLWYTIDLFIITEQNLIYTTYQRDCPFCSTLVNMLTIFWLCLYSCTELSWNHTYQSFLTAKFGSKYSV